MIAAGLLRNEEARFRDMDEDEAESPRMSQSPGARGGPHNRDIVDLRQGSSFKIFMSCKPPTFKGGDDALTCLRWIRKMEQTFSSAVFTEEQKVNYAIRMLEGQALEWWDSIALLISAGTRRAMTWETFSRKVRERFCSDGAIQRAEKEFLALQKGTLPIAKYNSIFSEKLQFARDYCPTEAKMIRRYVEGLPFEYRATVRQQSTLVAAMDEALRVEDDIASRDRTIARSGDKRKREGQFESSKKQDTNHDGGGQK